MIMDQKYFKENRRKSVKSAQNGKSHVFNKTPEFSVNVTDVAQYWSLPDNDDPELWLQLRPLRWPEHQPHQVLVPPVGVAHCLRHCFR